MKIRLLASCAAVAVLALTGTALQAQQPLPDQRPAAGAAGDTTTTNERKTNERPRRGGDAATSRPAPARSTDQPAAGGQGRGAADDARSRPSQAQSPSQDNQAAGGRDRGNRATRQGTQSDNKDARRGARPDSQDAQQNAREGKDGERSQRSTGSRDRDDPRRSAGERTRDRRDRRDAETERSTTQTQGIAGERQETRGSASVSQDRRASEGFSARIDRENVRPLSRTNISVTVGATVPRSVRMYDVPRDVVTVYPRYRGHKFVVVEDEIVVIEPRSRRIVATLPRAGSSRAAATTTRSSTQTTGVRESRLHLSDNQRQMIRTSVMREPRCRLETRIDFVLLVPLPRTVEVCDFPAEIVSEVPEVQRYRFVVRGDEIAIVDPAEYRVVEVIE